MEFDLKNRSALDIVSTDWLFAEDADAEKLAFDMIKYMQSNRGIGLAANQIGMTKRVFVMGAENILGFPKPFALVHG